MVSFFSKPEEDIMKWPITKEEFITKYSETLVVIF